MKKYAFTLIEIMIVVAVVGLLASMASLAIMKGIKTARISQAEVELEMIGVAVLDYFVTACQLTDFSRLYLQLTN